MAYVAIRLAALDGNWVRVTMSGDLGEVDAGEVQIPDLSAIIDRLNERTVTEQDLYGLALALRDALLPVPVRRLLRTTEGITLGVETEGVWLGRLPWEFVARPHDGSTQFWLRDGTTSIVRLEGGPELARLELQEARFAYLGAQASGGRLARLQLDDEYKRFGAMFRNDVGDRVSGNLRSRRADVIAALETCDLVHITCHGQLGELLLHNGERLGGSDLSGMGLVRASIVLVGACESSYRDPWSWNSLASGLLDAGVQAVVAMPFSVETEAASSFMHEVWTRLAHGEPISRAVALGRASIGDLAMCDWAVPVLHASSDPVIVTLRPAGEGEPSPVQALPGSGLGNLPASVSVDELVGRDRILDDLALEVESHAGQSVDHAIPLMQVLIGMSGVGKSALAEVHAARMVNLGTVDACWWVRSEDRSSMSADLLGLATYLQLPVRDSESATFEQIRAHLESTTRRWLIVLDNATSKHDVEQVAPRTGNTVVVVTSTNVGTWAGRRYSTRRIPVIDKATSAARMLIDRTSIDDKEGALEVVERLGNLPIAIVAAAAMITTQAHTFSSFLQALDASLESTLDDAFVAAEQGELIPRGMRWLLDQVRNELRPSSRRLLETLSWLDADSIPVTFLDCDALLREHGTRGRQSLADLQTHGLVTVDGPRLRIHRLIRSFVQQSQPGTSPPGLVLAARCLLEMWPPDAQTRSGEALVEELLPHLVRVAEAHEAHGLVGAAVLRARAARVVRLRGHLLDAQAAIEAASTDEIDLDLVCESAFVLRFSDAVESQRLLEPVQSDLMATATEDSLRACALLAWHWRRDRRSKAVALMEQIFQRYRESRLPRSAALAEIHGRYGDVLTVVGRYDDALIHYRNSREIVEAIEVDHPLLVVVLSDEAIAQRRLGNVHAALDLYEAALRTAETRFGDRPHEATDSALNNLGFGKGLAGEHEQAIELLERAIVMAAETKGERSTAYALRLSNVGRAYARLGRIDEAREAVRRARDLVLQSGARFRIAARHAAVGAVELLAGNSHAAVEALRATLEVIDQGEEPYAGDRAIYTSMLAEALALTGDAADLAEALDLLQRAEVGFQSTTGTDHYLFAEHLIRVGVQAERARERERARDAWTEARRILGSTDGYDPAVVERLDDMLQSL